MEYTKERAFFRVQYPLKERPSFFARGTELVVWDVSEFGLRFAAIPRLKIEKGDEIEGTIRFRNRGERKVEGVVVWKQGPIAALQLKVPIPFVTVLNEQRYLRSKYSLVD
jgi:hypothetical protein